MPDQKKGNIFDQAIDLMTNRDEKAAMEAAKQRMQELETQLSTAEARVAAAERNYSAAQSRIAELEQQVKAIQPGQGSSSLDKALIAQLQQRLAVLEPKARAYDELQLQNAHQADTTAMILDTYTTGPEDTLSGLALKYYGRATPKFWRLIYEANKAVIGNDPNHVRVGSELRIPVLPEELKGKAKK